MHHIMFLIGFLFKRNLSQYDEPIRSRKNGTHKEKILANGFDFS